MGQDTSSLIEPSTENLPRYKYHKVNKSIYNHVDHENILRIARTPFEGCQKFEMEDETYFIEHTKNNLSHYVKSQKRLKQRFSNDDIIKIIENVSYALAYLESTNIPYPLLSIETVFCCTKQFKILPPIALKSEIYCKLKRYIKEKVTEFVPASPEMIIAARCQEPEIKEKEILYKSNVFAFGLILLEVCTQKSSSECYDLETYEILDEIITERIEEIEQNYSNKIVRIIANMLDYDYEERMTPKELSVWINREFHETDEVELNHEEKEQPKVFYEKEQQERNTVQSRFITETENGSLGKKQLNVEIETKNLKEMKSSSKRMNEIRAKINKEKKVEKMAALDMNNKSPNKILSKSPSFIQKELNMKRFTPNPYLNQGDLNLQAKNTNENKMKDHEEQKNYREPISSSKINDEKYYNRYQYQEPNMKPSKGSGLKYKYNIDSDDENKESPKPSSFNEGSSSKRNYARGYSRNKNENLIHNYNHRNEKTVRTSNFSFEPLNYQQLEETKKIKAYDKYNEIETSSKRTLLPKENYKELTERENIFEAYKNSKQNPYENRVEKSEQITYHMNEKHDKQKEKENNSDMLKIKEEIEKSKAMIKHVQRMGNSSDRNYV